MSPPIWGASVIEAYKSQVTNLPHYIEERQMDNRRKYAKTARQRNKAVFTKTNDMEETYDAYEKDIAIVSFYFKEPAVLEFGREAWKIGNCPDFALIISFLLRFFPES